MKRDFITIIYDVCRYILQSFAYSVMLCISLDVGWLPDVLQLMSGKPIGIFLKIFCCFCVIHLLVMLNNDFHEKYTVPDHIEPKY